MTNAPPPSADELVGEAECTRLVKLAPDREIGVTREGEESEPWRVGHPCPVCNQTVFEGDEHECPGDSVTPGRERKGCLRPAPHPRGRNPKPDS